MKTTETFEKGFFNSTTTYVHPTSIVGNNVKLGKNVKVGPFCTITGNVSIESGTRLFGYLTIGLPAQDVSIRRPLGSIVIGKNCEIREFVTISAPKVEGGTTRIGDDCYIMNFSHIAHDVTLEHNVTLINNVNLAGHVHIEHHTMLMASSALHQHCRVGAYSALAPFSGMRQDLPPFSLFNGMPGRFAGLNAIALKRAEFSRADIDAIKTITKLFYQDKLPFDRLKEEVGKQEQLRDSKHVQSFLQFVHQSGRGISRKTIHD